MTEQAIHEQTLRYTAAGVELAGHLACPAEAPGGRPGVLVVHEWWGLNDYVRGRARMLAGLGYNALAVDMYGGARVAADPAEAGELMNAVLADLPVAEARFDAALEGLAAAPGTDRKRLAAIGYCFGGGVVLDAARRGLPLAAVVSFHGALRALRPASAGGIRARILVCHGAADELVPEEQLEAFRAEMDAAGADYRVEAYPGALHGFTNPDASANGCRYGLPLAYDEAADRRSWDDMRELLAASLAG